MVMLAADIRYGSRCVSMCVVCVCTCICVCVHLCMYCCMYLHNSLNIFNVLLEGKH